MGTLKKLDKLKNKNKILLNLKHSKTYSKQIEKQIKKIKNYKNTNSFKNVYLIYVI